MVDADHIGHPLDAFRHPLQVPECSGTWPDADYAACIGDGASVVSAYQPASAAGMRGQRGRDKTNGFDDTDAARLTRSKVPCATSTTIPRSLHRRTTCAPKSVRPPCWVGSVWISPS